MRENSFVFLFLNVRFWMVTKSIVGGKIKEKKQIMIIDMFEWHFQSQLLGMFCDKMEHPLGRTSFNENAFVIRKKEAFKMIDLNHFSKKRTTNNLGQ